MKKLLLGILFALSFSANAHYQIGCSIYNKNLQVLRDFAGSLCVFLPNGSFVQYIDGNGLSYLSKLGELIWHKKIFLHHQINLSNDSQSILVLANEYYVEDKVLTDFNSFIVFDLKNGRQLKKYSLYANRQKLNLKYNIYSKSFSRFVRIPGRTIPPREFLHSNSFYEIPSDLDSKIKSRIKNAQYVVNFVKEGPFFLDKDLKEIVWRPSISHLYKQSIHDVQLLSDGRLLFYSNEGPPHDSFRTSLHSYDLKTNTEKLIFPKDNILKISFLDLNIKMSDNDEWTDHAVFGGGLQLVDEGVLFSVNSETHGGRIHLANKEGKILKNFPFNLIDPDTKKPRYFQEVKERDHSDFLKNNRI